MLAADDCILTLDIDWAPDWMIDHVAQMLIENRVKATWFVTHQSEAVDRLREHEELFELGIHPNMLNGSTHGGTEDEVLAHVLSLVPNATSMRTHGLYQSSGFLAKAAGKYGLCIDSSLFLPRVAHLSIHRMNWSGSLLWRVPYFWEDDYEMLEDNPIWELDDVLLDVPGLRVFDFHPVHIVLNVDRFEEYCHLKRQCPVQDWDREFIHRHSNEGRGPRTLFLQLVERLSGGGRQVKEILRTPKKS